MANALVLALSLFSSTRTTQINSNQEHFSVFIRITTPLVSIFEHF